MDEASVEQAIKDKLLVDERLLKRLIKVAAANQQQTNNEEGLEDFYSHSKKIESFTTAAAGDVEYFEHESLVLANEFAQLQTQSTRMRITLQAERDLSPQFDALNTLHTQLKELGERDLLLKSIQTEELELEKLRTQIQEEEKRITELKERLENFLSQFRTNE